MLNLPLMGLPGLRLGSLVYAPEAKKLAQGKLRRFGHTRLHASALAAASGVLLALSFPKFGHPAFGWIALAPLLVALDAARHAAARLRARPD